MWCVSNDEIDFASKHWYPIFSHTFLLQPEFVDQPES